MRRYISYDLEDKYGVIKSQSLKLEEQIAELRNSKTMCDKMLRADTLYLSDLVGQSNSLAYGLFEDEKLIGVSMGQFKMI